MVWTSFLRCVLIGCVCVVVGTDGSAADHPRLYFKADELPRLRQLKHNDPHRGVWANLKASADWITDGRTGFQLDRLLATATSR